MFDVHPNLFTTAAGFPRTSDPGGDRLALVIDMTVARDGSVAASDIYRAMVQSKAKLAYNGVGAWLEGTAPAPAKVATVAGPCAPDPPLMKVTCGCVLE